MSTETGVSGQQIFDMLMESQFWSADQMRDYQRSQLAQLLRHAKAHVPFYKTRLDCVLRKDGSIDWDRWEEIPIVTRADLRDRGGEMLSTFVPQNLLEPTVHLVPQAFLSQFNLMSL
jgi:phenylacetate-CoA ligase